MALAAATNGQAADPFGFDDYRNTPDETTPRAPAATSPRAADPLGLGDYRNTPARKPPPPAPAPAVSTAPAPSTPPAAQPVAPPPTAAPAAAASDASGTRAPAPTAYASTGAEADLIPAVVGLPPNPTASTEYRIGTGDLLLIEVFQAEELSSKERVDDGGNVVLPLIGRVRVGGLTREQAEALIAAELGRDYLQNPQINIFVEEYASQSVTVTGAVKRPGVFPITGPTTLVQALALAEGLTAVAEEESVILFRRTEDGRSQAYVIDVERILEGTMTDPLVVGNDRVVVPESGAEVFVKGLADTLRGFVRPWGY